MQVHLSKRAISPFSDRYVSQAPRFTRPRQGPHRLSVMNALIEGVGLVAVVVAVAALARRVGLLTPILLVVVGLVLSFVPRFPIPEISPNLVIVAVLPPLLYVAATEIS